jgi:hypothetical protein
MADYLIELEDCPPDPAWERVDAHLAWLDEEDEAQGEREVLEEMADQKAAQLALDRQREDARAERIQALTDAIRDHRCNPWGSMLEAYALEEELTRLYNEEDL